MFRTLCFLALLLGSASAFAEQPKAPPLADLMKHPTYRAAWTGMLTGEAVPDWVEAYAKTLDGPAIPTIPIPIGSEIYMLGFTCQPNGCGDNQLYVLFSPSGGKAWGLLLTGSEKKWLGAPDQSIQDAILNSFD